VSYATWITRNLATKCSVPLGEVQVSYLSTQVLLSNAFPWLGMSIFLSGRQWTTPSIPGQGEGSLQMTSPVETGWNISLSPNVASAQMLLGSKVRATNEVAPIQATWILGSEAISSVHETETSSSAATIVFIRKPPPRPISLEFPSYVPPKGTAPLDDKHMQDVCQSLASIRRLTDIKDSYLGNLNIHLKQDVPLSETMSDPLFQNRPFLYDDDLNTMLEELETNNEDAFREILRQYQPEDKNRPRLAYSRNFFTSLEDMSRYWDESKDEYYEVEPTKEEQDSICDAETWRKVEPIEVLLRDKADHNRIVKFIGSNDRIMPVAMCGQSENTNDVALAMEIKYERAKLKQVYKGNRIGNGEQMSSGTRISAIRNLLKMATHKFSCRDCDISPREKLRIRNINVPAVSYSFCVAKVPCDTRLVRARMVEGPLIAVHCRNEIRFKNREGLLGPTSDFVGEKFDFFREIGGLLMLAKQRARDRQSIVQDSKKTDWWSTEPRWGGSDTCWGQLPHEVYEDDDPSWSPTERRLQLEKRVKEEEGQRKSEAATATDLNNLKPEDLMSGPITPTSERPKKKKKGEVVTSANDNAEYRDGRRLMHVAPLRRRWYQEWTKIRPNGPCVDEKLIPRRIGKPDDSGWDTVFMLSAANHHACILKLSVHEQYLNWLEGGEFKADVAEAQMPGMKDEKQPHILYMNRSQWFDLLDVEERKHLLTGIWGILSWMNRGEVPQEEIDKLRALGKEEAAGVEDQEDVKLDMR
jgi:hypothetical protein